MVVSEEVFFEPPVEDEEIVEEEVEKENLLFAFIDSISFGKQNMLDDPERDPALMEKEFSRLAYVVKRGLSLYPDTIFQVQDMNRYNKLDGKIQYNYLLSSIKKKKRYPPKGAKWFNKVTMDNLDLVKEYFDISTKKAITALDILTEEDIKEIKRSTNTGGLVKKTRKSSKEKE